MKCTYGDNICKNKEDTINIDKYLNYSKDIYEKFINKSLSCY